MKKLTTQQFIEKARDKHGPLYDYSQAEYKGGHFKVKIGCPIHGAFEQRALSHMQGCGCRACAFERHKELLTLSTKEFIEAAKRMHGDAYDYSLVDYSGALNKVMIICKTHGVFSQPAAAHASTGHGCPACGREENFKKNSTHWTEQARGRKSTLYLIRVFDQKESFYKIGVTHRSVRERYYGPKKLNGYKYEVVAQHYSSNASAILEWEVSILGTFAHLAYKPLREFEGFLECFNNADEILSVFPL